MSSGPTHYNVLAVLLTAGTLHRNGACQEEGKPSAPAAAPKLLVAPVEEETSELILKLRQKTADNAEKNAQEVKEKTLSAQPACGPAHLPCCVPRVFSS